MESNRKTSNKHIFPVQRCVADKSPITISPHGTYASLCAGTNLYNLHILLWWTILNNFKGHEWPLIVKQRLCGVFFYPKNTTLITKILTCGQIFGKIWKKFGRWWHQKLTVSPILLCSSAITFFSRLKLIFFKLLHYSTINSLQNELYITSIDLTGTP